MRRVVITGMGWITPLGHTLESVWGRLLKGDCGIGPVTRYDASTFVTNFASEVKGFRLADFVDAGLARDHAAATASGQFALAAAASAWKQAGFDKAGPHDRSRMGVYLGSGEGKLDFDNFAATNLAGWRRVTHARSTARPGPPRPPNA